MVDRYLLLYAVRNKNIEAVKTFLHLASTHKCEIAELISNKYGDAGWSPLLESAKTDLNDIVDILLSYAVEKESLGSETFFLQ